MSFLFCRLICNLQTHLSSKSVAFKLLLTTELFHWFSYDEKYSIINSPHVLQAIFPTPYEFMTIQYSVKSIFF